MRAFPLPLFWAIIAVPLAADDPPRPYTGVPAVVNGVTTIWHHPGDISQLDFRDGIGGPELAPAAPFTFVKEDASGTSPKVQVKDANHRTYVIKFGPEAIPDTFATRMVWAVGYWTEQNYLVKRGVIEGVQGLGRAAGYVEKNGRFLNGRFQLRSDDPKYLDNINWNWDQNPFVGTPQLNGLKIMMMLVSNWDDKDFRDAASRGGNTAIYQQGDRYIFFIDDWGASFGSWGKFFTRSKWKPNEYLGESHDFVKGLNIGIQWGYSGQHTDLMTRGVRPSDARWLMQYLGKITDAQMLQGLLASGATNEEASQCVEGLKLRIAQLRTLANFPDASTQAH